MTLVVRRLSEIIVMKWIKVPFFCMKIAYDLIMNISWGALENFLKWLYNFNMADILSGLTIFIVLKGVSIWFWDNIMRVNYESKSGLALHLHAQSGEQLTGLDTLASCTSSFAGTFNQLTACSWNLWNSDPHWHPMTWLLSPTKLFWRRNCWLCLCAGCP